MHHHEVATAGQCEIGVKFGSLVQKADDVMMLKYVVQNVAHSYGKTATFMPKPLVGDNGSGMHVHQSLAKDGKNLFTGDLLRRPVANGAVLHRRHLEARARAQRVDERVDEQLQAPRQRLRGADAARVLRAQSLGLDAHSARANPKGRRVEVRFPDSTANPYFAFTAMLMAGLDGIAEQDQSGSAAATRISTTCRPRRRS